MCTEEKRAKFIELINPKEIDFDKLEQVIFFKYIGTVIDTDLPFSNHVDVICEKASQRSYFLSKLKCFRVKCNVIELVYRSLVVSTLTFNIVTWYGNLSVKDKTRLNRA